MGAECPWIWNLKVMDLNIYRHSQKVKVPRYKYAPVDNKDIAQRKGAIYLVFALGGRIQHKMLDFQGCLS